jgi:molybdenum cofactor cytidylyltransferase
MCPVNKKSSVGLIILAAGESSRMGKPKQLLPFGGKSLIQYMVQTGLTSRCFPVVVVLGANAALIQLDIAELPVFVAENAHWAEGMGSSIRTGMEMLLSVNAYVDGVIIMLCDQPYVKATLLNQFIDEYHLTHQPLIASAYAQTLGVPALFDKSLFPLLLKLQGKEGARKIIAATTAVHAIAFPEGEVDIDTPEDYLSLDSQTDLV